MNKLLTLFIITLLVGCNSPEVEEAGYSSYLSAGGQFFGRETLLDLASLNSSDWNKLSYDLNMPAENSDFPGDLERNARAVKFHLRHEKTLTSRQF